MPTTINTMLQAGSLEPAVAAANDAVRKAPSDINARILLAELLIFTSNFERADVVLDAASTLDPSSALIVSEFRQLLRAETARRQFWRDGRVPEVLGAPTAAEQALMAAIVAWRVGDTETAVRQCNFAETLRPRAPVRIGDRLYADFRNADDLCGGNLEVLTATGKFYWLPFERIDAMLFHPPRRPRDLAWRRADLSVTGGPEGTVYLPALYTDTQPPKADALRLGRQTEWTDASPVRGSGQHVFLADDEGLSIMDLTELQFGPV
jgi:type VI secretion system protein ImpE